MSFVLKDGTGSGRTASVNTRNRLEVDARSSALQHSIAHKDQEAYQVIGTATHAASTVTVLHIKNTHATKDLVVTYIRVQSIDAAGGTALPSAANYFSVALNRTVSSGGAAATPVNTTGGSGTTATGTFTQTAPTMAGTAGEIDRWYAQGDGIMMTFNKEGSIIVPQNQTLEVRFVGDHTSGTAYARVSFYYDIVG